MNLESLTPSAVSIAFAGSLSLASEVTPHIDGLPDWITALGLPVAMLVAVVYALISTNNERKASEAGRLADRDSYLAKLETDAVKASESRERLILASAQQAAAMERLTDEIRRTIIK